MKMPPPLVTSSSGEPQTQNEKNFFSISTNENFFSISTNEIAESVDGWNSFLTQSTGEL